MMIPATVRDPGDGTTWRRRRAWPRSPEHALVELGAEDGRTLAAQWFAESSALRREARRTPAPARVVDQMLLQPEGVDADLPWVRTLLTREQGSLLVHRPGRRAVVYAGHAYAKIVRAGRSAVLVDAARSLRGATGFVVPPVLGHDPAAGIVWWASLPGRSLLELGADPTVEGSALADAWARAGTAVAELHGRATVAGVSQHDTLYDAARGATTQHDATQHNFAAEQRVTMRALRLADAFGVLDRGAVEDALARVDALPAPRHHVGLIHRDLHDKQLLVPTDGPVGILDIDTLVLGDPAVDVANLLVHLQLRRWQGLIDDTRWETARAAFLDGLAASAQTHAAVPAYVVLARLRLATLYAFRPHWRAVCADLLRQ